MIPLDSMPQIGLLVRGGSGVDAADPPRVARVPPAVSPSAATRRGDLLSRSPARRPLRCRCRPRDQPPRARAVGSRHDADGGELRRDACRPTGRADERLAHVPRRHLPLRRRADHAAAAAAADAADVASRELRARGRGSHEHCRRRPGADGRGPGREVPSRCARPPDGAAATSVASATSSSHRPTTRPSRWRAAPGRSSASTSLRCSGSGTSHRRTIRRSAVTSSWRCNSERSLPARHRRSPSGSPSSKRARAPISSSGSSRWAT